MSSSHILITGGTGYIGSHTCVELIQAGHSVLLLDNLSNSHIEVLNRIERITGERPGFIEGDIRDSALLDRLFADYPVKSVIHFAGLKAVGESVEKPLEYYDNNVRGTLDLLAAMRRAGVRTLVFSSSATVYGDPHAVPIREHFPLSATNPYGRSKLMVEEILGDLIQAEADWRIARLRYFNPVGAHPCGLIGEDPNGIPNSLMPFIAQVAVGQRQQLSVFGDDYPTGDGTGVRDYIHVVDLARGHLAALKALEQRGGLLTVNLGTGTGYSVLDMVKAFERACGRAVPYRIAPRRPGDIAQCYADPSLARELLGWHAEFGIDSMCADTWHWQSLNPQGYRGA
jgi:UDP-glucose 4-epimerase